MADACYEPLGGDMHGVILCILPAGHEGDHNGGAAERALGERHAADMLLARMDDEDHRGVGL